MYIVLTTIFTVIRFGSGVPNVCVICEYDALPEIGHACGHNLIAEAGVAAGIGVKAYLESTGTTAGTVTVIGTPAEEGGGGKVHLIEKGGFDGVDVAMMVHPAPSEIVIGLINARSSLQVEFTGKAAHAAAFPWEGINALDAVVLAYNNVSVLRQQMKPTWRVHSIISNGGTKPNIIPEKASLYYYIRAPSLEEIQQLREKVVACFEAAATATGCTVEIKDVDVPYTNLHSNPVLARLYAANLEKSDIKNFVYEQESPWSTDMGNVSYVVPSLHPNYAIGSGKEVNHTREFTAIANAAEAHDKTLVIATALANTCIDVLKGGESLVKEIKDAFNKQVRM